MGIVKRLADQDFVTTVVTEQIVGNDDQSHAIDFVNTNKDARTVNLTRLGIGSDRRYNY